MSHDSAAWCPLVCYDVVQISLLEEQFGKGGEVRLDATAFVVSGMRPPAAGVNDEP